MYVLSSTDETLKETRDLCDLILLGRPNVAIILYLMGVSYEAGKKMFNYNDIRMSVRHVSSLRSIDDLKKDIMANGYKGGLTYVERKDQIAKNKVISFCLWGDAPRYMVGALKNAQLARRLYSDFECWFFIHRPTVPVHICRELEMMDNVRVYYRDDESIASNLFMAWRFGAIDHDHVDVNMSRDVDTRILPREVLAVREWLATDSPFHIMRDSPCHYNRIMGGMFGTRKLPGLAWTKEIGEYFKANASSNDQDFLLSAVYDRVKDVAVIHDEVKKYEGDRCRSFPIPYDTSFNFVGQYVLDDDSRIDMYTDILARYVSEHMPHRVMKKIDLCIVHYTKLTDRKRLMKDQLRETCLDDICSVHWIDSFDREILTPKIVQENYLYRQELCPRPITMGEIANGMAHSHILEECSRRYEVCMVVEDDMIFTPGFTRNLFESLEQAPPDWEVLAIGGAEPTNRYIGQPLSIIKSPTGFTPTGCFVIKQSLARRIVSHRLFKPFSGPIDHNLNHIFAELIPVVYWVEPFIAYEGSKTIFGTSFTDRGF
jgi:GR25 family glycosyltransferase involved in LPS biosynthesis